MGGSSVPPKLPSAVQRDLDLSVAVARERLLETHVRFLLEFVERARSEVAPPRVLVIYSRLQRLAPTDGLLLAHRMLVELGQRGGTSELDFPAFMEQGNSQVPWDGHRSFFARIRHRLRGRVNPELRRWVELHTGRTAVALLEVHVENALRFVQVLRSTMSYSAVIELYAVMLNVPLSQVETIYLKILDRLGRAETDEEAPRALPPAGAERSAAEERPLRIVDGKG